MAVNTENIGSYRSSNILQDWVESSLLQINGTIFGEVYIIDAFYGPERMINSCFNFKASEQK